MASAPPLETFGLVRGMQPPSYEETMQYPYPQQQPYTPGYGASQPGFTKLPMPPAMQQPYPMPAASPGGPVPGGPTQGVPAPNVTGPVVSVQTIYMQPGAMFNDVPVQVQCPRCLQVVVTRLHHTSGTATWLTCAALFIFGCLYGCCLIPFCVNSLKDVKHLCPNCNNVLGVYKRI